MWVGMVVKSSFKNHAIVCGYGVVGQKVVSVLLEKKIDFVIIDIDPATVQKITELKYNVISGDATSSKTLKDAGIDYAKAIAILIDNDAKNLFAVLTARDLNPGIFIATRANDPFAKEKLTEAGADYVVLPQKSASKEIVAEITK